MTREEIMAMQPGWELDALVLEKVMGWEKVDNGRNSEPLYTWYSMKSGIRYDVTAKAWLFRPSTDISAAWEVYEWFVAGFPDSVLTHPWYIAADYRTNLDGEGNSGWNIQAEGDTAPEAICKAALLACLEDQ